MLQTLDFSYRTNSGINRTKSTRINYMLGKKILI